MNFMGKLDAGSTAYITFHTFDSFGASVTMTGFALGDILVYKNGSTTQRSSTAGFTLLDTDGTDFDGFTGLHGFKMDLSDNTDAGFWAAGNHYDVAIASITVDSRTVNLWVASFDIVAAAPTVNVAQWNGTNVSTPATAGIPDVNIKKVNNVTVNGDGSATPWGP